MRIKLIAGRNDNQTTVSYDSKTDQNNGIIRDLKVTRNGVTVILAHAITIASDGSERNAVIEVKVIKGKEFDASYMRTLKRGDKVTEISENKVIVRADKIGLDLEELFFADHEVNEAMEFLTEVIWPSAPKLVEFAKSNDSFSTLLVESVGAGKDESIHFFAGGLIKLIIDYVVAKAAAAKAADNATTAESNVGTQA